LILKMEVIWSSRTLVDFQQTTRCYIPEDKTLHNHHCDNLKSYNTKEYYVSCVTSFPHSVTFASQ
jgi:hypothetical protein